MSERVTIDDVAKKLNISRSLVSKALNDKYGVNPQTKAQIRYTALQMGYNFHNIHGNQSARTDDIGVLVGNINRLFAEGFYLSLIQEVESVCAERQLRFSMQLLSDIAPESLMNASRSKFKKKGFLLVCCKPDDAVSLASYGIPFVAMDFPSNEFKVNRIQADFYSGGAEAVSYLLECGHRKIGYAGVVSQSMNFTQSYRGYCDCMRRAGITGFESYCCLEAPEISDDSPLNAEAMRKILISDHAPTAFLCANDNIAVKMYSICEELGLKIPEDISLIGFDNMSICQWMNPPLTSVSCDLSQMARHAVHMLENAIRYPGETTGAMVLDTNLMKRESVAVRKPES